MASEYPKRTTHRTRAGTKVYAVRGKSGKFKDIQKYERAHRRDIRRTTKAEASAGAAKAGSALERALGSGTVEAAKVSKAAMQSIDAIIKTGKRELENVGKAAQLALKQLFASTIKASAATRTQAMKSVRQVTKQAVQAKNAVMKAAAQTQEVSTRAAKRRLRTPTKTAKKAVR